MYCKNCGTPLPDNAKFCNSCGAKNDSVITEQPPKIIPGQNTSTAPHPGHIHCPKCKSHNLQYVTNTQFSSKTTGGGYSGGKGCLGYLLLGPFGLLCGSCGSKQKTETHTTTTNTWICTDCGTKFRDADEIEKDINTARRTEKVCKACGYALIAVGIISILASLPLIFQGLSLTEYLGFSYFIREFSGLLFGSLFPIGAGLIILTIVSKNTGKTIARLENERVFFERNARD